MNSLASRTQSLRWAHEYGGNALKLWRRGEYEAAASVWRTAWSRALHAFGRPDRGCSEGWTQLAAAVVHRAINDGASGVKETVGAMRRENLGHHSGCKPGQVITDEMAQGFIGAARNWVRSIYGSRPVLMRTIEGFWNDPRCRCGRRIAWPAMRCEVCQRKEDKQRERMERERERALVELLTEGDGDE